MPQGDAANSPSTTFGGRKPDPTAVVDVRSTPIGFPGRRGQCRLVGEAHGGPADVPAEWGRASLGSSRAPWRPSAVRLPIVVISTLSFLAIPVPLRPPLPDRLAGSATYVGTSTLVPSAALRRAASRTVAVATASHGSTGTGPVPRTAPANCS